LFLRPSLFVLSVSEKTSSLCRFPKIGFLDNRVKRVHPGHICAIWHFRQFRQIATVRLRGLGALCVPLDRRSRGRFFFGQRKGRNEVRQAKRFSLAMLLVSSALGATMTPAFAQSGSFPDPDQRWLLGVGILALTLIIAFLMAWYLPMGPNGAGPRRSVSRFLRKTRRRHRRRQFNRGGAYGGGAYLAPSPTGKRAHDISPYDESENL
jgi:hypothetical protein